MTGLRLFHLKRIEDVHGVSGTGVVAEGVEFSNGMVALTWLSPWRKVDVCENIKALEQVHGHEGRTVIVWVGEGAAGEVDPAAH